MSLVFFDKRTKGERTLHISEKRHPNHSGPPWTQEEAETFFKELKHFGKKWSILAVKIPNRTPHMCLTLYSTYKHMLDDQRIEFISFWNAISRDQRKIATRSSTRQMRPTVSRPMVASSSSPSSSSSSSFTSSTSSSSRRTRSGSQNLESESTNMSARSTRRNAGTSRNISRMNTSTSRNTRNSQKRRKLLQPRYRRSSPKSPPRSDSDSSLSSSPGNSRSRSSSPSTSTSNRSGGRERQNLSHLRNSVRAIRRTSLSPEEKQSKGNSSLAFLSQVADEVFKPGENSRRSSDSDISSGSSDESTSTRNLAHPYRTRNRTKSGMVLRSRPPPTSPLALLSQAGSTSAGDTASTDRRIGLGYPHSSRSSPPRTSSSSSLCGSPRNKRTAANMDWDFTESGVSAMYHLGLESPPRKKRKVVEPVDIWDFKLGESVTNMDPELLVDLQSRMNKCIKSDKFRQMCIYEWYYPTIDALFFEQNEFVDCLNEIGFGQVERATRSEWTCLRSLIGKPKRLSQAFLRSEREKLERYRSAVRRIQSGEVCSKTVNDRTIPLEVPDQLRVGHRVIVLDSQSSTFESATVENVYSRYRYRVKFDNPSLGHTVVDDLHVMPLQPVGTITRVQEDDFSEDAPFPQSDEDVLLVATISKTLERKELLVQHLKDLNDQAKEMVNKSDCSDGQDPIPSTFQQEYAYVVLALEKTNKALDPAMKRLKHRQAESQPRAPMPPPPDSAVPPLSAVISSLCSKEAKHIVPRLRDELPETKRPNDNLLDQDNDNAIDDVIEPCVTLLMLIKNCVERNLHPVDIDILVEKIRPRAKQNLKHFELIKECVSVIKSSLSK